ncbi:MAG: hypothetical protein Q9187_001281 [Circinaria calcarea]
MAPPDDRGPSLLKLNVAMIVVATIAVGLRFWSRAVTRSSKFSKGTRFWWDDWLALANLVWLALADNSIPIHYWLSVEAPISILSICLPSIFFLIKRGVKNGPYSLFSSREVSSASNTASQSWRINTNPSFSRDKQAVARVQGHASDDSWERLHERGPEYDATAFRAPSKRSSEQSTTEADLAMQSIRVRQEIDVRVKQTA